MPIIIFIVIHKMRTIGASAKTNKYKCEITVMGEIILCEEYPTLKQIAEEIEIPYHTVADFYEGRRSSFNRYSASKYFPVINITKLGGADE